MNHEIQNSDKNSPEFTGQNLDLAINKFYTVLTQPNLLSEEEGKEAFEKINNIFKSQPYLDYYYRYLAHKTAFTNLNIYCLDDNKESFQVKVVELNSTEREEYEKELYGIFSNPKNDGREWNKIIKLIPLKFLQNNEKYCHFDLDLGNPDLSLFREDTQKDSYEYAGMGLSYFNNFGPDDRNIKKEYTFNFIKRALEHSGVNVNFSFLKVLLDTHSVLSSNRDFSFDEFINTIKNGDFEVFLPLMLNIIGHANCHKIELYNVCIDILKQKIATDKEYVGNLNISKHHKDILSRMLVDDVITQNINSQDDFLPLLCIDSIFSDNDKNRHILETILLADKIPLNEKYYSVKLLQEEKDSSDSLEKRFTYLRNISDVKKLFDLPGNKVDQEFLLLIKSLADANNTIINSLKLDGISKEEFVGFFDVKNDLYIPNAKFFERYSQKNIQIFDFINSKKYFRNIFGEEVEEKLLKSLPNNTIERRNAFTQNEYDRTSKYLRKISMTGKDFFSLKTDDISILADFISEYGFCESDLLIKTYFAMKKNTPDKIPEIITKSNIKTTEDLKKQYDDIFPLCCSVNPINKMKAEELNLLQKELVSTITGLNNGRWSKYPINKIIENLPPKITKFYDKHLATTLNINILKYDKNLEFDQNEKNVYKRAVSELLFAADNPSNIEEVTRQLKEIFTNILNIEPCFDNIPQEKQEKYFKVFNENKKKNEEFCVVGLEGLEKAKTIDDVLKITLPTLIKNFGKYNKEIESMTRILFFKKILERQLNSSNFVEQVITELSGSEDVISINVTQTIINIYSNFLKDHVLNDSNEENKYWSDEMYTFIKNTSKLNQKLEIKNTIQTLNNLDYKIRQSASMDRQINILSIPDCGLIGELSGYIGDACYTKVIPLLSRYQNLVPYKFIHNNNDGESEIIGSCLVFEEKDSEDNSILLIRALNLPKFESQIDIGQFVEKFADQIANTAKNKDIKMVLVAPTSGTISNYPGVSNYVIGNYIKDKEPVKLKGTFNFNGHDITNSCRLIRKI